VIGLPSLQAIDRAQRARIWMASEATDMRCGFDRLAERVKVVIGENPQSGHLFVFRSRRGDRLKILGWDRDSCCGPEYSSCRAWSRDCDRWSYVPANWR
jgi:transposase